MRSRSTPSPSATCTGSTHPRKHTSTGTRQLLNQSGVTSDTTFLYFFLSLTSNTSLCQFMWQHKVFHFQAECADPVFKSTKNRYSQLYPLTISCIFSFTTSRYIFEGSLRANEFLLVLAVHRIINSNICRVILLPSLLISSLFFLFFFSFFFFLSPWYK